MAETKRKGDLGEAMIMADVLKRGYKVALPVGEDWRFDLIVLRKNKLVRVQCKYVTSDGLKLFIPCRSSNDRLAHSYTPEEIDWLACYDATTDKCYYVPSEILLHVKTYLSLRLTKPRNSQKARIRFAQDFEDF